MRLNGRRQSSNFDDRRGRGVSSRLKVGGGIGAVIIAAIIAWISGGNPLGVIMQNAGQLTSGYSSTADGTYTPTAEEEQLATFSRQILAGTEDVWTKLFASQGLEYEAPTLVFYTARYRAAAVTPRLKWARSIVRQTRVCISTCHFSRI